MAEVMLKDEDGSLGDSELVVTERPSRTSFSKDLSNKSSRLKNRLHAACRHRDKGYTFVGFVAVQPASSRVWR